MEVVIHPTAGELPPFPMSSIQHRHDALPNLAHGFVDHGHITAPSSIDCIVHRHVFTSHARKVPTPSVVSAESTLCRLQPLSDYVTIASITLADDVDRPAIDIDICIGIGWYWCLLSVLEL